MPTDIAQHPREAIAGLLTLGLGAAIVQYSRGLPDMPGGYPGPGLFPGIVGVLFVLFGLALVVQAATGHVASIDTGDVEREERGRAILNIVVIVAAVPIYTVLSAWLGFIITMMLVSLGVMLHLRVRLLTALTVAVIASPAIDYVFRSVLRVPLPLGPFGW